MSTAPVRRRKDAIEKAAAIEGAATDLVLEHGYDAVTVDMICDRVGVSQRTFFNHFGTKESALLGSVHPTVDAAAAERFIHSDEPLLPGAARIVRVPLEVEHVDPENIGRRIRAVGSSPTLMGHQMQRIMALEGEIRDVIWARLARQYPDEEPDDRDAQARLISGFVAAVLRYAADSWSQQAAQGGAPNVDPEEIVRVVTQSLAKISP